MGFVTSDSADNRILITNGLVCGTFSVSLGLGSLGFSFAGCVFLLARRLPGLGAGHVADLRVVSKVGVYQKYTAYSFDGSAFHGVKLTGGLTTRTDELQDWHRLYIMNVLGGSAGGGHREFRICKGEVCRKWERKMRSH